MVGGDLLTDTFQSTVFGPRCISEREKDKEPRSSSRDVTIDSHARSVFDRSQTSKSLSGLPKRGVFRLSRPRVCTHTWNYLGRQTEGLRRRTLVPLVGTTSRRYGYPVCDAFPTEIPNPL